MALPSAAGLGEGGGDRRAPGGQQAVGAAEHGVLLVQQGRRCRRAGRLDRRHRGIAAEADDEGAAAAGSEPARLETADGRSCGDALGAAQQAAAGKPRRRDAEDLDRRQAVAEAAAAAVGEQDHAPAAGDAGAPASASAGKQWPPVPPAASSDEPGASRSCRSLPGRSGGATAPAACPWPAPARAATSRHS